MKKNCSYLDFRGRMYPITTKPNGGDVSLQSLELQAAQDCRLKWTTRWGSGPCSPWQGKSANTHNHIWVLFQDSSNSIFLTAAEQKKITGKKLKMEDVDELKLYALYHLLHDLIRKTEETEQFLFSSTLKQKWNNRTAGGKQENQHDPGVWLPCAASCSTLWNRHNTDLYHFLFFLNINLIWF